MMLKTGILVLLAIASYAQQCSANISIDDLLNTIFEDEGTSGTTASVSLPTNPVNKLKQSSTVESEVAKSSGVVSCKTSSGFDGECVNIYLCNETTNTIVPEGMGLIDIRFKSVCPSYLEMCCKIPDKLPEDNPIIPAPVKREGCGWRYPNGVGFHTKGDVNNEAKFGEFPWMVAILKLEPVGDNEFGSQTLPTFLGGGSLIHPNVVLTAAHTVHAWPDLRVRVGEWDTQTTGEVYPHQERAVKEVIVHKDFNNGSLFYDVALLFLFEPFDVSQQNVGLACLPLQGVRATPGARCQTSGWGKNLFEQEGQYQVILKRIEVPAVARYTCQTQLRGTRLGRHFQLHSSFMCAGGEPGKDACTGDGGSPLVCPVQYEKDRYLQHGIVAWGIGCGTEGVPGVYVDVANFRSWIDDKVIGHGYDPSTYTY